MDATATVTRARWIVPAEGDPIPDGAVVAVDGRIARIGPWPRLAPHIGPGDTVAHWADAAVLPAFVNSHTHLAYSDMAGKFHPTCHFAAWIARITARRYARTAKGAQQAVARGADEAARAATAAGAELTPDPERCDALATGPTGWTVFVEVFRYDEAGLEQLAKAIEAAEALERDAGLRVGLSPHTPWTVGVEVFLAARREADRRAWPLSTHLHETLDEIAMTERGEGKLCAWLRRLGMLPRTWKPAGLRPIPMLAEAGFFSGPVLAAHGNYLEDEEIAILARSGSSVAYCPRSHAFFKHPPHPWRRLRAGGVNVCLGTDSLASCPTLSMLDEMRFLFGREPDADPRTLLAMATVCGARALGLADVAGDLREGLGANLAVVGPLPSTLDPLAAIVAGEGRILHAIHGTAER